MIRLVLADSVPLLVVASKCLLANVGDIELVGTAFDEYTLLELITQHQPTVVMTDVELPLRPEEVTWLGESPKLSAFRIIKHVREHSPNTVIIFFTRYDNEGFIEELISTSPKNIRVIYRNSMLGSDLAAMIRNCLGGLSLAVGPFAPKKNAKRLSDGEYSLLAYMAQNPGASLSEFAEALGTPIGTINRQLAGLYSKLGTTKRAEAIIVALQRGLIPLEMIMTSLHDID